MKYFRILSYIEAGSLLALFLIAMPLKYLAGQPEPVRIVGTIHGALFVLFVMSSILIGHRYHWSVGRVVLSWVIASIPLGPVLFEKKLFGSSK